jgi:hypothetical protein
LAAAYSYVGASQITSVSNLLGTGSVTTGVNGASTIVAITNLQSTRSTQLSSIITSLTSLNATRSTQLSSGITSLASLNATRSNQLQAQLNTVTNLSGSYTTGVPTYLNANITAVTNLNAGLGFSKNAGLVSRATALFYSINPNTPAAPKFANINARATLTAIGVQPTLCECPPWIPDDNTTCGWSVDSIQQTTITTSVSYDLPFTLPVFRIHVLGTLLTSGTTTTTPDPYTQQGTLSPTYTMSQVVNVNYVINMPAKKTYGRPGCT